MENEPAPALDGEGTVLMANNAKVAAFGAALLSSEGVGLLFQEGSQGALYQAMSSGSSELLHGLEVDVHAWARLAKDAACDDFSPASGQVTDLLKFFC
jgi:hypothetical protein